MDKATLVRADIATGPTILQILDNGGLPIQVAMWLHTPEYEDWRFVLASRELDVVKPSAAYGRVHDTLEKAGFLSEDTPALMILKMSDPFIRALRRLLGKLKNVEGMRLGGQMLGDRFIDDAVIYRIR